MWSLENIGFGEHGERAAMVDDQFKNIAGAVQVPKFIRYIHTYPRGVLRSHPGVLLARMPEQAISFGAVALQNDDNVGVFPGTTYKRGQPS